MQYHDFWPSVLEWENTKQNRNKQERSIQRAGDVIERVQNDLETLYHKQTDPCILDGIPY